MVAIPLLVPLVEATRTGRSLPAAFADLDDHLGLTRAADPAAAVLAFALIIAIQAAAIRLWRRIGAGRPISTSRAAGYRQAARSPQALAHNLIRRTLVAAAGEEIERVGLARIAELLVGAAIGNTASWWSLILATAIWTAWHRDYHPVGLAALALMGLTFAWAYQHSGSVWTPIVVHLSFNALLSLIVFLRPATPTTTENPPTAA